MDQTQIDIPAEGRFVEGTLLKRTMIHLGSFLLASRNAYGFPMSSNCSSTIDCLRHALYHAIGSLGTSSIFVHELGQWLF